MTNSLKLFTDDGGGRGGGGNFRGGGGGGRGGGRGGFNRFAEQGPPEEVCILLNLSILLYWVLDCRCYSNY